MDRVHKTNRNSSNNKVSSIKSLCHSRTNSLKLNHHLRSHLNTDLSQTISMVHHQRWPVEEHCLPHHRCNLTEVLMADNLLLRHHTRVTLRHQRNPTTIPHQQYQQSIMSMWRPSVNRYRGCHGGYLCLPQ
jgi:hypothetical protein